MSDWRETLKEWGGLRRRSLGPDAVAEAIDAAIVEGERWHALAGLLPQIHEALTNDTLLDEPDVPGPCECEDCGRLRIDALTAVYRLLKREA
jgi:hypothetical protein